MHSFDDYYYFYLVVKHGGFSAASEVSSITKSKLSRRILDLENRFNVSLIQRSTRHFKVTPLGQEFYEECEKVIHQADCAQNILLKQKHIPSGLIKLSCPSVMMEHQIRPLLNEFLVLYPDVQVEMELTSRRVDILHDDIDLAIRTNFQTNEDSNIIVRDVIQTTHCLVASPELLKDKKINTIKDLEKFPSIVLGIHKANYAWSLHNLNQNKKMQIILKPRIKSSDLSGVYSAALDGLGIADLPFLIVENDLKIGKLIHILPEWCSNIGTVQLVYTSRKGQRLIMEKLIDHLINGIRNYYKHSEGYLPLYSPQ